MSQGIDKPLCSSEYSNRAIAAYTAPSLDAYSCLWLRLHACNVQASLHCMQRQPDFFTCYLAAIDIIGFDKASSAALHHGPCVQGSCIF